jgi:predicted permease
MTRFLYDLRFALRALRTSPGFTAVAVLSLGLGIGANTAIFSLIHAAFQRTLPVERPEELVVLTDPASAGFSEDSSESGERSLLSWQEFDALRRSNQVFSGMFAAQSATRMVDAKVDQARLRIRQQLTSGEFFEVLGVRPVAGRCFTAEDDSLQTPRPVAVISYSFWQRQFRGDPNAIGKSLSIGTGAFHIIGVAPPNFRGVVVGSDVDVWMPMTTEAQVFPGHDYLTPRDTLWLQVLGRLKPGTDRATAEAAVNVAFQQVLRSWGAAMPTQQERKAMLDQKIVLKAGDRGVSHVRSDFANPLALLMAMVGIVLLIACANIANLTLARATGRQRELGVRLALGAGRFALIRQMLTESLLVACAGGVAGSLIAVWCADLVISLVSGDSSGIILDGRQDPAVFLFTAAASLVTVVLFGLVPALRATRVDVNRMLAAAARGTLGGRGRVRSGGVLVAAQIALSILLLFGATLLVRTLNHLAGQKLGFDREHLLMAFVDPPGAGYRGPAAENFMLRLTDRLRAIPGVRGAALSTSGMFAGDSSDEISVEGVAGKKHGDMHSRWTLVGASYFRTVGTPLLRGRELTDADELRHTPVCVVNESFVRSFFKDADPIGKHITDLYPTTITTFEVVGVVADSREHELRNNANPRFYGNAFFPIGIARPTTLVVRAFGDPVHLIRTVTQAINQFDATLPVNAVRTVDEQIGRRLVAERMLARLAAAFGALALLMAAIGIYGVMSYAIGRRTSEIGLRMALGASQAGVMSMVLRETMTLLLAGVAIGLPAAIGAARLMGSTLAGVSPADPVSLAVALAIIGGAAVMAGYVPARRAARIDPIDALRCE